MTTTGRRKHADQAPAEDQQAGGGGRGTHPLALYLDSRIKMLGMNPTSFAKEAKISKSTLYRLLGDRPPESVDTDQLKNLAAALDVDPRALAELWHGIVQPAEYTDERENLLRAFVLSTAELSEDEVRAAVDMALQVTRRMRPAGVVEPVKAPVKRTSQRKPKKT